MSYFNTRRSVFFVLCPGFDQDEQYKLDRFLLLLEKSTVGNVLNTQQNIYKEVKSNRGRPQYNICNMFATILYGFAHDRATLRQLEESCKYDLRYIYLMNNEHPSYASFCNFFNQYILPNEHIIFSLIMRELFMELKIPLEDAFVDGTKIEANANKYKFVWKPTTYHLRLNKKIIEILKRYPLGVQFNENKYITSQQLKELIIKLSHIEDKRKEDLTSLVAYLEKVIEYEQKEAICGPDRNSYYKTDTGATAMCLKEDYYSGLGSNMHAAYSIQLIVIRGMAAAYLVSQSRSDTKDFPLVMDIFHEFYDIYPKRVCADSAYGTHDNYEYLEKHDIENYLKYQSWEGNVSGKRPDYYRLNDDLETITCLNGKTGRMTTVENRHPKNKNSVFFNA